jgi:hypothetical protein
MKTIKFLGIVNSKILKLTLLVLLSSLILSGCESFNRTIERTSLANLSINPLDKDQYNILEDTQGTGSASGVLGFGIGSCTERAKHLAEYEAIGKIPGADMLIAPRYEIHIISFLFFFKKSTVIVKAKAIQLKTTHQ